MPDYSFIANAGDDMLRDQGQMNQNMLFQGQRAAGQALQQSVGPDGQIDYAKAASLIGQNRLIAPFAMQALQGALTARGQDISNTQAYAQNLRRVIASVTLGPDEAENGRKIASAVARGGRANLYPAQMANEYLGGAVQGDGRSFGADAREIAGQAAVALNEPAALENQFGTADTQNIGGATKTFNANRMTGQVTPMAGEAASIPNTLAPAQAAAPRGYVDRNTGEAFEAPTSAFVAPTGQPKPNQPGVTGPQGQTLTGLAPGEGQAMATPKVAAANQSATLLQANEGSVPRSAQLKELLAAQGDFRSGPGAAKWSGIVTEFNRLFGTKLADDAASSQQTFGKLAEQVAEAQRGAMGSAATNAQTEAARIASPNSAYSPEANRRVIALLLGNEDYIRTKAQAWQAAQKHGWKPSQFNQFAGQFNELYDPRFFAQRYMTSSQLAETRKAMSPAEQKQYDTSKQRALNLRWDR